MADAQDRPLLVDAQGRALTAARIVGSRADSWMNERTGIGTAGDKTMHGVFAPVWRIFDSELTNLMNGSALAAKIVEKPVFEMFRRGYEIEADGVEKSACDDLRDYARDELRVDEHFEKAQKYGDGYGGFLLVLGADDGGAADEPLEEEKVSTFQFLNGIDRRFAYVLDYYSDPFAKKYGEPQHYLTSNCVAGFEHRSGPIKRKTPSELKRAGGQVGVLHESRCIRFEGIATDQITQQTLAGWTWSVLQRVYDDLRKFEHSFDSMQYLLADASQAVFSLKDLHKAISAGKTDTIMKRVTLLEEVRSVMRGIVLDAGDAAGGGAEKYERSATPFTGLADLLDKCMLRFAAACDMPVTELFGRAASGLNAAAGSDSETRKWYDKIASRQERVLAPRLRRFYSLLAASGDCPVKVPKTDDDGKPLKWRIKFKPLFAPTDQEQAETDLKRAQTHQIYLSETVVTPEEVALEVQGLFPNMDVEAREKAIKGGVSFDPAPNDEPEDPAGTAGGEIPTPTVPLVPPGMPGATPPAPPVQPAPKATKKPAAKAPAKKTAASAKKTDGKRRR